MKKIIAIAAIALGISVAAVAQPKAIGGRLGYQTEVSYLHTLGSPNFIEVNAGIDFNSIAHESFGFTTSALYNFVFAQPNWTSRGDWEWYAGPGISLGWVNDPVHYKNGGVRFTSHVDGFMVGLAGQVGLSYTFWFPLQLSVDIRPIFGIHVSKDIYEGEDGAKVKVHDGGVDLYNNGVTWNWAPTLSVRYAF